MKKLIFIISLLAALFAVKDTIAATDTDDMIIIKKGVNYTIYVSSDQKISSTTIKITDLAELKKWGGSR